MLELADAKILVTGGAGFIGSHFIRHMLGRYPKAHITNLDLLTYAGHPESLKDVADNPNYTFVKGDICDSVIVGQVMQGIDIIVHFAAESHVDRSIVDPITFVKTNVVGTAVLLNAAKENHIERFHHVSTDEVYGQLGPNDPPFSETTPYNPRTPYSASKAGSDHLVRAYFETFGLPVTITNTGNNYGPYQDPEKLIPRFITNLIDGQKVPLMGEGKNRRDWTYVIDHIKGIELVLLKGVEGETYCIGGDERTNKEVTLAILKHFGKDESWIQPIPDRLGHDFRYALDTTKIEALGWRMEYKFDQGLGLTIDWCEQNEDWWRPLKQGRPDVDPSAQKAY